MGAVAARTGNIPGIPYLIAGFEAADAAAHFEHHAAGIPAENAWLLQTILLQASMNLGIDRVDGNGFHFHQQIVLTRCGFFWSDLDKTGWIFRIDGNGFD
ncbi:hypothetical protein D3C75_1153060 [compost metagenome]